MADFPDVPTFAEAWSCRRHHDAVVGTDGAGRHAAARSCAADAGARGRDQKRAGARAVESDLRADRLRRAAGVRAACSTPRRSFTATSSAPPRSSWNSDMKRSTDRIRTTHAGRLPVSPGLENLPVRLYLGEVVDPATIAEGIAHGVRKQIDLGIDCVGDGEFWKARDFIYYSRHLTGLERRPLKPGETGSTRTNTRERDEFAQFYKDSRQGRHDLLRARRAADAAGARVHGRQGPDQVEGDRGARRRRSRRSRRRSRGPAGRSTRRSSASSRRAGSITSSTTNITRPTRSSSSRSPRRCARNIWRSSTPASSCRSTIPAWSTGGTC